MTTNVATAEALLDNAMDFKAAQEALQPLSFAGRVDDQAYAVDVAITTLQLPAATGGTKPYTYTLTPAVPAAEYIS